MIALVTGAAGFIGSTLSRWLLQDGTEVIGVDAFTPYYSPEWKNRNVGDLLQSKRFSLARLDLVRDSVTDLVERSDVVFHLAAQPGVRASWGKSFSEYVSHNVDGTQRLLEACAAKGVSRLVFASSSSVYGDAERLPTSEDATPRPVSPYGVTKLAAESLVYAYAKNFGVPATVLRYFTVYGPAQRPDMGFHRFIVAALADKPIELFGDGQQTRDVTYVDDVVRATVAAGESPRAVGATINVGGGSRVSVNRVLEIIGDVTGKRLAVTQAPQQPGDVRDTGADLRRAVDLLGYRPDVGVEEGLANQTAWIRERLSY